jgi:hypothetical protein
MRSMAKKLLVSITLSAMLFASSPALAAQPNSPPRAGGVSAYVMMVLELFFGPEIGEQVSLLARELHQRGIGSPGRYRHYLDDEWPQPEDPIPH